MISIGALQAPKRFLAATSRSGRLAVSTVLGAASAFSFAPYFFWPLMLVAFCGLVWLLDTNAGPRHAAACGWFFGFGQFVIGLYWLSISFQFQANMPAWIGWIAVVGLSAYLAIYPSVALWLAFKFWSPSPGRILILAAGWAATEWLRGHLLTGFPWNMVAQIWSDTPMVLQSARLFGAYGLTLLTVTLFASAALLAERTTAARRTLMFSAATVLLVVGDGSWRLAEAGTSHQKQLRVHLVQANIRQDLDTDPERQATILDLYERMTVGALRQHGPGLVVWPETAVESDVEGDGITRSRLGQIIGNDGLLILGAVGQSFGPNGAWIGSRNSLLAIDGDGTVKAVYDKARLVPFGEYLPAGNILSRLGLVSVAAGSARFLAGSGPITLTPGVPPFSPLICYEIIFPGKVVDRTARPTWLLNISNDAWFGNSSGPHQHLAQARMRAVEEGLPVVRSTPTGISAIIDAYGRVTTRTALGQRVVLTGDVPSPIPATVYGRTGDWLFLALLSAWVLIGTWSRRSFASAGTLVEGGRLISRKSEVRNC